MNPKNKVKEIKLICPVCEGVLKVGISDRRTICECGWSSDISIKPHDNNQKVDLVEYIMEIHDNDIAFNKYHCLGILKNENEFYKTEYNEVCRTIDHLYDYAELAHNSPRLKLDGSFKGYKKIVYYTRLEDHLEKEKEIKKLMYHAMKNSFDTAKFKVLEKIKSIEKEMEKYIDEN